LFEQLIWGTIDQYCNIRNIEMDAPARWQDSRTMVIAWLMLFFPVGLYGVWAGKVFDVRKSWMITGGIVVVLLILQGTLISLLVAFLGAPASVYLVWRDKSLSRVTLRNFAITAVVIAILALMSASTGGEGQGGSCAEVETYGSCTYYRDSQCNVIGQSCD